MKEGSSNAAAKTINRILLHFKFRIGWFFSVKYFCVATLARVHNYYRVKGPHGFTSGIFVMSHDVFSK